MRISTYWKQSQKHNKRRGFSSIQIFIYVKNQYANLFTLELNNIVMHCEYIELQQIAVLFT